MFGFKISILDFRIIRPKSTVEVLYTMDMLKSKNPKIQMDNFTPKLQKSQMDLKNPKWIFLFRKSETIEWILKMSNG